MIESVIRFILTHVPLIMFVLAILFAALTARGAANKAEHWLGYMLLFAVGIDGLWAGLFHLLWPHTAAAFIGWQVSPFQFEIGVSDAALGFVAVMAFWRPLDFKAAIAIFATLFYIGVAYGHVHQMIIANNFAPGNVGIMFFITLARSVLLPVLVMAAYRARRA